MALARLQKIIARAGRGSRRAAEQLIVAGRVRVNGRVVRELGARADDRADRIEVDGVRLERQSPCYLVLHKPRGVMSTLRDPEGRPTVAELVSGLPARLYPVGRLDFATSGVLLLTNDGDFAQALLHPRERVPKTYVVKLDRVMDEATIARWRSGIELADGLSQPAQVRLLRHAQGKTWLEVTLSEGRHRQIRRMAEQSGFNVMRLARTSFAGITVADLRPGRWRLLTVDELRQLKRSYGVPRRVAAQRGGPPRPPAPAPKSAAGRPTSPRPPGTRSATTAARSARSGTKPRAAARPACRARERGRRSGC